MKLKRKILSDKYYGHHTKVNVGTKENVLRYLEEISNFLHKYEFESDQNFIFCGRKKYIIDEIDNIINKDEISYDTICFILGLLEEFMCSNNHIAMGEYDSITFTELRDKNDEYVNTGIICKEEKECIEEVVQKIKKYLDGNSKNNLDK